MYPARLLHPFIQGAAPTTSPRAAESPLYGVPFASERTYMPHHEMWGSTIGPREGLLGVFGTVGRRICRISNVVFGE